MNEKSKLMNAFAAEQFAAWELHLYLDTHLGYGCLRFTQRLLQF